MKKEKETKKVDEIEMKKEEKELFIDTNMQKLIKEVKKLAKKDFAKLSAITAVILSMGIWIIKGFWYTYFSGKFSVYKIDSSYIDTSSDNVLLQIMQVISIIIVGLFINYCYYIISVKNDKSKFHWKRKLKKFIFWAIEMFIFVVSFMLSINVPLLELVKEITIWDVLAISLVSFIFCFTINIYAIELALEVRRKEKKKTLESSVESNSKSKKQKQNWIESMLLGIALAIAVEMFVVYVIASRTELNRKNYKVIMIESVESVDTPFDISYIVDNNKYQIYPIVFENQDCYILTRLYYENGEVKIDYNYQRIVEKSGQEIIYVENVYEISGDT